MEVVEEFDNNNRIIGFKPEKKENAEIIFKGENNTLVCEENVNLSNSKISFNGDNAIVYLSSNDDIYLLNVSIYNNSVLFIDEDNYMSGTLNLILSEEKNIFIGKNCLFSWGIWFRLADPHLIYDMESMNRINPSRSIYVGDHVWFGQDVLLLKGTQIGSGSIIGAKSLVSNKKIPSNTIWGGNPAKQLKKDVFFDKESVHNFTHEETEESMKCDETEWIYRDEGVITHFDSIERNINKKDVDEKINFLVNLRKNKAHNRFYM